MIYRVIRGFNYKGRRFEVGSEVSGLPIKATKQLIAEKAVEVISDNITVEESEYTSEVTEEEGGEDIDG